MNCVCNEATGVTCGYHGNWQRISAAPAIIAFESGSARRDEAVYRRHNVTHTMRERTTTARPTTPDQQCKCGNCSAHAKRNRVTGVAAPGKEI